jgi:glutaryl-CoA dehydrogenase
MGCSNDRRAEMATAATTAAVATKPKKQPKPLPAPNSDFYEVYETLNPEELATVKRVRTFMEANVAPVITKYWVDAAFPSSCCRP